MKAHHIAASCILITTLLLCNLPLQAAAGPFRPDGAEGADASAAGGSVPGVAAPSDTASAFMSYSIDGSVVTGTRNRTDMRHLPMTISVVDRERLESSRSVSILPVLNSQVPGFFSTSRGLLGYGVSDGAAGPMSVRGIGGPVQSGLQTTGLLVLIDGHPQYMGLMGHQRKFQDPQVAFRICERREPSGLELRDTCRIPYARSDIPRRAYLRHLIPYIIVKLKDK